MFSFKFGRNPKFQNYIQTPQISNLSVSEKKINSKKSIEQSRRKNIPRNKQIQDVQDSRYLDSRYSDIIKDIDKEIENLKQIKQKLISISITKNTDTVREIKKNDIDLIYDETLTTSLQITEEIKDKKTDNKKIVPVEDKKEEKPKEDTIEKQEKIEIEEKQKIKEINIPEIKTEEKKDNEEKQKTETKEKPEEVKEDKVEQVNNQEENIQEKKEEEKLDIKEIITDIPL